MTWEDRYRTDRILNKLHQISPHFRLSSLVLTRQASSFSQYSAAALREKLQNVLVFHNKEQFKGASTRQRIKTMQEKKFGQWQQALGFIFFLPQDLSDSISLVWPGGMNLK